MKKLFTIILISAFTCGVASAQESQKAPKRHYFNFGYVVNQELTFDNPAGDELLDNLGAKADWGASIEGGSTFFMHKKPILGMIRIGLDYTYMDIQYATWKYDFPYTKEVEGSPEEVQVVADAHFAMLGMQLGPSVTVSPIKNINLKAYVRYSANFAALYYDFEGATAYGGYAGLMNYGLSASYRTFTVGIESKGGKANFTEIKTDSEVMEEGNILGDKQKVKLPSTRVYFGFRF